MISHRLSFKCHTLLSLRHSAERKRDWARDWRGHSFVDRHRDGAETETPPDDSQWWQRRRRQYHTAGKRPLPQSAAEKSEIGCSERNTGVIVLIVAIEWLLYGCEHSRDMVRWMNLFNEHQGWCCLTWFRRDLKDLRGLPFLYCVTPVGVTVSVELSSYFSFTLENRFEAPFTMCIYGIFY